MTKPVGLLFEAVFILPLLTPQIVWRAKYALKIQSTFSRTGERRRLGLSNFAKTIERTNFLCSCIILFWFHCAHLSYLSPKVFLIFQTWGRQMAKLSSKWGWWQASSITRTLVCIKMKIVSGALSGDRILSTWYIRPQTPESVSLLDFSDQTRSPHQPPSSGGKIRKSPELTTFNQGHLNRRQLLSWTFVSCNSPDRVSKLQFNCYSLENYQWKWLPMVLFWRWQYFQNVSFPFPTISK